MLLELLSRLPDLDPRARPDRGAHAPGRAAHLQQLARADRGAQAPLPVPVARLPDARARARDRAPARARAAGDGRARGSSRSSRMVRELDLKKPPSIAESIDWARALLLLGAEDIDARRLPRDDVDHRQAPHRPRHRGRARRRAARRRPRVSLPAHRVGVRARRCAREGVAIGTSELNDAFAALGEVGWTEAGAVPRGAGRDAGQVARGPARLRPRVRALLLPRRRGRGARARASREGDAAARTTTASPAASGSTTTRCASRSCEAIRDGDEAALRDLARLAIAAFGRRGEGSGVLGVDVQRIRRALGPALRARRARSRARARRAEHAAHARPDPPLRAAPAARARARADRAHAGAAAVAAAERARPRAAVRPAAGPRRRAPRRRAAQAPARHPGPRGARAHAATRTSTCAARCARRCRPAACPVVLKYRPQRPRRPELYVLCDVSHLASRARRVFFLSACCTRCTTAFRKMRSFVFVERISEVTDVFERERSFKAVSDAISKDAGVADVSGYTDYGRVWREFLALGRGRPAPARDRDRARRRAHQRPRPARRRLRPHRRARRPHVLAQPRAAAVLELRRLA